MKKNITIYVATHKLTQVPLSPLRKFLFVGVEKNPTQPIEASYQKDNVGENISIKNNFYSELTGLYWMWKNANADIVGLEHYRRFFTQSMFKVLSFSPLPDAVIEKDMQRFDFITTKKIFHFGSNKKFYGNFHYAEDWEKVENIIAKIHPDYLPTFRYVSKLRWSYLYNMFIGKKKLVDRYCAWLFAIFNQLEPQLDLSTRTAYQKRVYGFLSERLFTVWLVHHKSELNIKERHVCFPEFNFRKEIVDILFKKRM
jgi:hypothetical protein